MSIIEHLEQLLEYGLERKLISIWDREYTRNRLYEALGITHPEPNSSTSIKQSQSLPEPCFFLISVSNLLNKIINELIFYNADGAAAKACSRHS